MNAIIERLVEHLKWRKSAAGKKYRPKKKERVRWGAFQIPQMAALLVWASYLTYALLGAPGLTNLAAGLDFVLFDWPGIIGLLLLLTAGTRQLNSHLENKAYEQLLEQNERFTLVEYARYLSRQIELAQDDPSLGGPAEVERLQVLRGKLTKILRESAKEDSVPIDSTLAREADLAELVVESYEIVPEEDPLKELDERLPDALKQRVEELEQELEAHPVRRHEREG
ncbi:hypothetical protein JW859_09555 [bacterium]|nr:hypothetical protein [bacterium]